MKEALFILLVILILFGFTAIRYRKQIVTMLNVWRMLKTMRQSNGSRNNHIEAGDIAAGPLVNCAKCGTWVPEDNAIRLGRTSFYCSANCMEKSAKPA